MTEKQVKRSLLGGVASIFTIVASPSMAAVQEQEQAVQAIDEIIVTVQKREQSLQDVPLSVTVFTNEQIKLDAIVNLTDYADKTPGFFVERGVDVRSINVVIRGVGRLGGSANTFGLYMDEFELTGGLSGNANADITDIERIEVLRGPQGTAFGRNVVAGAINLTSIKPTTDGFSGNIELEAANHDSYRGRGAVNIPLVEEIAAIRFSVSYQTTDGNLTNLDPSGQSNDNETLGLRAALNAQ